MKELYYCTIGNCNGSSSWIQQQSENTQANGPQIEPIKGCLDGGLRRPSASIQLKLMLKSVRNVITMVLVLSRTCGIISINILDMFNINTTA